MLSPEPSAELENRHRLGPTEGDGADGDKEFLQTAWLLHLL